jgi:hypothetical protein
MMILGEAGLGQRPRESFLFITEFLGQCCIYEIDSVEGRRLGSAIAGS